MIWWFGNFTVSGARPVKNHDIYSPFTYSKIQLQEMSYTFSSASEDSDDPPCFCWPFLDIEWLRRSLPPGFDEALPYQIIPTTAMTMPTTTCKLRPSFPKNMNPRINTRIVFMWPRTWNETAVNLPIQMNWLRFVPTAMEHERTMNTCRTKDTVFKSC